MNGPRIIPRRDLPGDEGADHYFLGGHDLEMLVIRELLERCVPGRVHDRALSWGAKASAYGQEISRVIQNGGRAVLVELTEDLSDSLGPRTERLVLIDHHGERAGRTMPTSLEQVFGRLNRPASEWTRWMELVAANDRGHVRAMQELDATPEELRMVRAADRRAQGITAAEEESGRRAAFTAESHCGGRLTVVVLPHGRTATVTDALDPAMGGGGYENLLILCPDQTYFFGGGLTIQRLSARYPGSFFGGELPLRGYWGIMQSVSVDQFLRAAELSENKE